MRSLLAMAAVSLASCAPLDSTATRAPALDSSLPAMQSFAPTPAQPPIRSNAQIAQDFLDLAFMMESGRAVPMLTRYEGLITVRTTGTTSPSLERDLALLIQRLRREAGLNIETSAAPGANITIEALPSAVLQRAVPRAACFVVPNVSSWEEFNRLRRSPQLDWTTLPRRDRAAIFVPSDAAPQEIRDCLHEELAQALGPLNDLYRLPDSVFNDDNIHAVLTGFDMLILKTHYAPELRNGMSRAEVARRLPGVLARLNPAGERGGQGGTGGISRDWINAMQTALSPGDPPARRREAAARAVRLANTFGWSGAREGFAHYAYGRLMVGYDDARAQAAFMASAEAYAQSSTTRIHSAHVAVQLAAFEMRRGNGAGVLQLVEPAIPVARAHENAALMSTLMMFQAEALEMTGRFGEARAVRLDSLSWARYGFGSEANVRARQREIAGLRPDTRT